MNDAELYQRLSINGRKFAVENHDINKIAGMYDSVIKSVLMKNNIYTGPKNPSRPRNCFDRKK
jgi:hypothetical protein